VFCGLLARWILHVKPNRDKALCGLPWPVLIEGDSTPGLSSGFEHTERNPDLQQLRRSPPGSVDENIGRQRAAGSIYKEGGRTSYVTFSVKSIWPDPYQG
jgi:hypothetical protein